MGNDIEEVKKAIEKVEQQILAVERDLLDVERDLLDVERGLKKPATGVDIGVYVTHLLRKEEQLREKERQLREEKLLLLKADTSDGDSQDLSREWIKHMLLPQHTLTRLPNDEHELEKVLFPEQPGKLPVLPRAYLEILARDSGLAKTFLISADMSKLPAYVSVFLDSSPASERSEMSVSVWIGHAFGSVFKYWYTYSSCRFANELLFNLSEKAGDSHFGTTRKRSRPDTLLTASGCTFLVGEDKFRSLTAAKSDLEGKTQPLSVMFYGEVQFILGYIAGGKEFQWVYINNYGKIFEVGRRLDLSFDSDRCEFLLSIGYAYQLIRKMVGTIPKVPGRRAMFSEDVVDDRVIRFYSDSVLKSIKNFGKFCESRGTELDAILNAYKAGEKKRCSSLPRLIGKEPRISRTDTYTVEISPLGYSPTLRSEHDSRMLAKNVCEALSVLHEVGLVHRDVRYPNIVQVSKEQFMLIDLETVAVAPFQVAEGFEFFSEWSKETLEGNCYTTLSDMYQLGKLLNRLPRMTVSSAPAQLFIEKLFMKEYTEAAIALRDPWLSDPIP